MTTGFSTQLRWQVVLYEKFAKPSWLSNISSTSLTVLAIGLTQHMSV